MTMHAIRRIKKEIRDLNKEIPNCFQYSVCEDDIFHWRVLMEGPADSLYSGGHFVLDVIFPQEYPFKPPRVRFVTPIWHPNITSHGAVCLSSLKDDWSPALLLYRVILHIAALLSSPNHCDLINDDYFNLYREDKKECEQKTREMTAKFAVSSQNWQFPK